MSAQDQADASAARERRLKRRKLEQSAPVDATEALESMLINAHRVAMTLSDLSIFRDSELSVAEWAMLKSLGDRRDVPLKEISAAAGVSRQRLRKVVSELQTKGLVSTSKAQEDDKRARMISATPLATKVLSLVSQRMKNLFPATGPDASQSKRSRSLVGAARSMDRVTRQLRRSGRKPKDPKAEKGARAKTGDDSGDDD
jgi:DNA-binding MarR family transcriptional regulator